MANIPIPLAVLGNAPISNALASQLIYNGGLTPPMYPDYHICDKHYGENLYIRDCRTASISLVANIQPTSHYAVSNPPPLTFPVTSSHGGCHITVEVAGPSQPPPLTLSREGIAKLVRWVISECAVRGNGLGGFVTRGINQLIQYTIGHTGVPTDPYPANSYFVTLTISDTRAPGYQPGDYDPSVPLAIASYNLFMNRNKNTHNSPAALKAEVAQQTWTDQANRMGRGNNVPWWNLDPNAQAHDEMNYECDADLGSPSQTDCTQIEWNQLTTASDTLTVGPGHTMFLHSNTCYLAISATISIVLSWNQIRTAVAALTAMCVQAPFGPPQGGRAYYQPPRRISTRRLKRDALTGWNALPPHANITIFQQTEPWTDEARELGSCTWNAVTHRQSVGACHKT